MKLVVLLLLGLLGSLSLAYSVDYTGYTIQECSTSSEDVADLVYGVIHAFDIDEISHRPDSVTVLVEPKKKDLFQGLHCKVVVEDVQKVIEQEALNLVLSRAEAELLPLKNDTDPYHKTYHTYNEIVAKVTDIAKQYPTIVKQSVAGTTLEGRNLPLLRITGPNGASKKTIFLNGGIHAREWVSPATMVYIIQSLAGDYGKDSTVTALLDQIEFYIIPISNPDGYSYTWTNDRLWRKNRNPNGGGCVGVDLNRNFDVYWGTGSSSSKCAADYHGAGAASEPEVKAIQNLVAGMPNKIGAIDIHAYGQYIMRPYGWTNALHPEETILKKLGDGIVSVIRQTTGTVYSSIRSAQLYPVSGASDDWFTVKQNLWGFCFELRDNGRYGFELPESQILGTAQEIYAGVLNYADFVLNNF